MKKVFLVLALAVLFVSPLAVLAQTSYGTVAGSITDSTGAAIPNANVTIKSRETGETHAIMTTSAGGFNIQSVGTGHYDVTVEATGFQRVVVNDLLVTASTTTSVSPVLPVGKASDTVEVSSATEILQTESGEVSKTITGSEISQLPISGLNAYTLVTTLPGVTTVTVGASGNGPAFSVNGSRPRANNYLIEGQDNNDAGLTGQGLQPANTESIENVTFLLNGYSAEYGYAGGGVSNVIFRSGTNKFHGSVFDRALNSSLNAISHNNKLNGNFNKTKFRENIYGGTFGGPILRDKIFAFGAYQQDHYRSSSILSTLIVPTTNGYATLNGANINPAAKARIATLVKAYGGLVGAGLPPPGQTQLYPSSYKLIPLGVDPVTGLDRGSVEYGGVQRVIGSPSNSSELDLKGDIQVSPMDKVQLRYIRSYSIVPYDTGNFSSQLPFFDTNQGGPAENAGIVYTRQFSPRLLNELRISYGRISYVFDLRPDTYSNPLAVGPTVSIAGVTGYGIPTNVPQGRSHNTYQLQDSLSYATGNHTMKFGFDIGQIRVRDAVPFVFYGAISYQTTVAQAASGTLPAVGAYGGLGNFVDDYSGYTSSTGQSVSQNFGSNIARPKFTNQDYFIQDHWKATPRLAIDFGLRYEYLGAPFNYLSNPATDLSNPYGSFGTRVEEQPNYTNLAPRLGFAFQPFENGKTVVRGAFGIFYDHQFTNIVDNIQASAPNAASPVIYGNKSVSLRGTPNWSTQFANLSKTPGLTNTQTTVSKYLANPLTYQYNLAIEQQLPAAFSLTLNYAGSRGEHLYSLDTLNPTINGGARLNPARGLITAFTTAGDSSYHGVSADLERKYRKGLLFRVSYTFSRALDDVSDPYSSGNLSAYPEVETTIPNNPGYRGRDWGLSAYHHAQRAVATVIYNTPNFHWGGGFMGVLAHIANNYTVSNITSFQTGSVYNVFAGIDVNGDGISNDRPVLTNPNAPINTFSVASQTFYTAAQGAAPGVYCDGSYTQNAQTKNTVTGANDNFCHVVNKGDLHFYLGDYQTGTQNSTIGRNAGVTPGIFGMDATAAREFKIHERQGIVFRAESFNILNHANTGVPNFTLYGTTLLPIASGYGRGTFANYASTGTGNRSLRFFLKYQF